MNAQAPLSQIKDVFNDIPVSEVLAIANDIKSKIQTDPSLIEMKDKKEFVTKADFQIQRLLLTYLRNSSLKGTYKIKAEEELSEEEKQDNEGEKSWQVIIDPLDGTSAFCKDKETWGVMVGACDMNGNLLYSWNLVSTGEVYSSGTEQQTFPSFSEMITSGKTLAIDVYDYGAGASEKFPAIFENISTIQTGQYTQTSYPAAIWAGWELSTQKLNGMLWLPSNEGKKWYPDYDLIFMGALIAKGLKIRLGKIKGNNAMIVIAPTEEDVDMLWNTGLGMISEEQRNIIQISQNPLQITN